MIKKNLYKLIALILVLVLSVSFSGCGSTQRQPEEIQQNNQVETKKAEEKSNLPKGVEGPYMVDRVVDGDTFIALIDGEKVRVRVLCIDTPESVAPEETGKSNTDEGSIASDRAKELLTNKNVYLEYDQEKYDQYDRTLAYVYFEDGSMFEEIMLSEGLAKACYYKPNGKHKDMLYDVQDKARKDKVGFWGTGFFK